MTIPSSESLIRPPLQRRSQESLERVLRAGLELLIDTGFDGFTLQEVSRRAGVSIGAIYSRIPSRDALLVAIHERAMMSMSEQEQQFERDSKREGLTTREFVETLVCDMANIMLTNASMLSVFMRQAPMHAAIWKRGAETSQATAQLFRAAFEPHRAELRAPHNDLAIDVAYRMVYCTIARRITHGPQFESDVEISDEALVRELGRAIADYLL
jgi:AcrR family transcriptional regulator